MIIKYLYNNLLLAFLFLLIIGNLQAQQEDLYNLQNTEKYARYLLASRQYNLAVDEFERLVFLDKNNDEYKNLLLVAIFKNGEPKKALTRIEQIYHNNISKMPETISNKYLVLLQEIDSIPQIMQLLNTNFNIKKENNLLFKWSNLMLNKKYKQANKFIDSHKLELGNNTEIIKINNFALHQKHKNPWIAGGLSAFVPGLGKVYTGNYIDALTAFIFVGGNAYQSYRGFKKNGYKSTLGWIFGGIAAGFYVGNIFGSAKAAIRFNNIKFYETKTKVDTYFEHRFF